jgi:hypothetical protein
LDTETSLFNHSGSKSDEPSGWPGRLGGQNAVALKLTATLHSTQLPSWEKLRQLLATVSLKLGPATGLAHGFPNELRCLRTG